MEMGKIMMKKQECKESEKKDNRSFTFFQIEGRKLLKKNMRLERKRINFYIEDRN